jgi:hypothetical protein
LSARASKVAGGLSPSAFAVVKLMAKSNCRLLNWHIRRLGAAQNRVDKFCGAPPEIEEIWTIGHQAASFDKFTRIIDRR